MPVPRLRNYRIKRRICQKLCFTVYEAESRASGEPITLKVLEPHLDRNEEAVYRFIHAGKLVSLMQGDFVCQVYDHGYESGVYYIASEACQSGSLGLLIDEAFPFPLEQIADTARKLASALRIAHIQGVVHGLLNPGSIYLPDAQHVKIDDFAFSWTMADLLRRNDGESAYLSHYAATEVYFRSPGIDGRADVYSLGAILLQMLTDGFQSTSATDAGFKHDFLHSLIPLAQEAYPQNAERLKVILRNTLHYNPNARYFNMKDLLRDLDELQPEEPRKIVTRRKANPPNPTTETRPRSVKRASR